MTDNVDHIRLWSSLSTDVKDLLIEEFKSSENLVKMLYIITSEKAKIDAATIYLAKYRLITTATGAYLDEIGSQLGVDRQDSTDEEYRAILQIRAYRVTSSGTRPNIIKVLSKFTGLSSSEVNTYAGREKSFDVAFYSSCLNASVAVDELVKLFPVVSSYRLLNKAGASFMFGSVYDDNDYSPDGSNGLGSVHINGRGGRLASLLAATN